MFFVTLLAVMFLWIERYIFSMSTMTTAYPTSMSYNTFATDTMCVL